MIFPEYKAIFFHAGKCAGTSVEKWIAPDGRDPYQTRRDVMYGWDPDHRIFLQHASAKSVRHIVGEATFADYFKFAVVRNPFWRIASVYFYLYERHKKKYGDFRSFVSALPSLSTDSRRICGSHYLPQTCYTHIDGTLVCDHVAEFEELPHSLEPVKEKLSLSEQLPKKNSRRHPAWTSSINELFDEESKSIVLDVYRDDFATFGYSTSVTESEHEGSSGGTLQKDNVRTTSRLPVRSSELLISDFLETEAVGELRGAASSVIRKRDSLKTSLQFLNGRRLQSFKATLRQHIPDAVTRLHADLPLECEINMGVVLASGSDTLDLTAIRGGRGLLFAFIVSLPEKPDSDKLCECRRVDESHGTSQSETSLHSNCLAFFRGDADLRITLDKSTAFPCLCILGELTTQRIIVNSDRTTKTPPKQDV